MWSLWLMTFYCVNAWCLPLPINYSISIVPAANTAKHEDAVIERSSTIFHINSIFQQVGEMFPGWVLLFPLLVVVALCIAILIKLYKRK
ncbi:hypothetical protein XENTR_v10020730 [Xenopus tropicalis]|nr:hypothetical protein XENTR_v10020730 [Xenopus tropicalis]